MIRNRSCWLLIVSGDRKLTLTARSLCWERTVTTPPAQKHQPPSDAYVRCVGVKAHPIVPRILYVLCGRKQVTLISVYFIFYFHSFFVWQKKQIERRIVKRSAAVFIRSHLKPNAPLKHARKHTNLTFTVNGNKNFQFCPSFFFYQI